MGADLLVPFIVFLLVLFLTRFGKGHKNLPPGPWGLPLLGHLAFLGMRPYRTLMTWKKKYGPVIYTRMGSYPCVFLCDPKVIKQAFGMAETAGRSELDALIKTSDRKGIVLSEGPRQKEQRHFAVRALKESGVGKTTLEGHIQDALTQFLDQLMASGGKAVKSSNLVSAHVLSTLSRILMTDPLKPEEAQELHRRVEKGGELGSVPSQLAIFMPWLETLTKLLTFGQISLIAERQSQMTSIANFMEGQVKNRDASRVKGEPRDIFDHFLDNIDDSQDVRSCFHPSHDSLPFFAGEIMAAGVHTTSATLEWMLLYMATLPLIQQKLQEEIDLVIGPSRLPALSDRPQMPYVDAAIYELLRLSSIVPLGLDHRCVREVSILGYRIPKGTLIFANIYGVHHDPEVWGKDVEEYKPERWLGEAGKKFKSDHFLAFSTGKRNCIGESLAKDTLFLFITGIFQKFSVTFEPGDSGPGLEPSLGLSLSPLPFKMVFTPRHVD